TGAIVRNNVFRDNRVSVRVSGDAEVSQNDFSDTAAAATATEGVRVTATGSADIHDNRFFNFDDAASTSGAIVTDGSATVTDNTIDGGNIAMRVRSGGSLAATGNLIGASSSNVTDLIVASGATSVTLGNNSFNATGNYIESH